MLAQIEIMTQYEDSQPRLHIVPRLTSGSPALLSAPQCAGLLLPRNPVAPLPWERILIETAASPTEPDPLYQYDDLRWRAIEPRVRAEALTADEKLMDTQGMFLRGEISEAQFLRASREWADQMLTLRRKSKKENTPVQAAAVEPPPVKNTPPVDRTPAIASLSTSAFTRLAEVKEAHHQAQLERELQDAATLKSLMKSWLNIDCEPKASQIKVGKYTYILTGSLGLGLKGLLGHGITILVDSPYRSGKPIKSGMIYDLPTAQAWQERVREKEAEVMEKAAQASAGKTTYFGKNTATARRATQTGKGV